MISNYFKRDEGEISYLILLDERFWDGWETNEKEVERLKKKIDSIEWREIKRKSAAISTPFPALLFRQIIGIMQLGANVLIDEIINLGYCVTM